MTSQLNVRNWLDANNHSLLSSIKTTISGKNISITFHKVKGHSNNYFNDIADTLAKDAERQARTLQIGLIDPSAFANTRLPYILTWKDHAVDQNIRRFTKNLTATVEAASWSLNSTITKEFDEFGNNLNILASNNSLISLDSLLSAESFVNRWDILWKVLCDMLKRNAFGLKATNLNSFVWKVINNCLPTLDFLKIRNHQLYANRPCVHCNTSLESLDHLLLCDTLRTEWERVEWITTTQLVIKLRLESNDLDSLTCSLQNAIFSPIEPYHPTRRSHYFLIRGILPEHLINRINDIAHFTPASKPLKTLLPILWQTFREVIWKPRCDQLIQWEREHNITTMMKRTYNSPPPITPNITTASSLPNSQGNSPHRKAIQKLNTALSRCQVTIDRVVKQGFLGLQHGWAYLSGKKK